MKIKKIINVIIIVLALSISFLGCSFVLNRQATSNEIRVKNFYLEEKNSLDVVLIGSSSVYTGYSAPYAWKTSGIKSYALATSGAPMGIAKSMMIDVLNRQKPSVILIDLNGIRYNNKQENNEGMLRFWIDNMPYSKNKIDTIKELIPKNERMTYYLPILKYHNNWERIKPVTKAAIAEIETNIKKNALAARGMSGTAHQMNIIKTIDMSKYEKREKLFDDSSRHLQELMNYCKENNIKNVAFVNMPRFYTKKTKKERGFINSAIDLVQKNGFKVYDFDKDIKEIGLDKKTDYYDINHLNIYGQQKMTKYLCNQLIQDYNMQIMSTQKQKEKWDLEYKEYIKIYNWVDNVIKTKDKEIKKSKTYKYKKYGFKEVLKIINGEV